VSPGAPALDASIFEAMFESAPDALLLVNAAGAIVRANAPAEAMLGYGRGELAGCPVDQLVPAAARAHHAQLRRSYAAQPTARPMGVRAELAAVRRDGREIPVEVALSPLVAAGRSFTLAAVRDVSAYPRVQQALERARYSALVARFAQAAMDAREPQPLVGAACAAVAEALAASTCVVFLLEPSGEALRVAGGSGLLADEPLGARVPNRSDTPAGFVVGQGAPVVVADYAVERRFVVPAGYLEAGLRSALAVPLSDRGRIVGALAARSRGQIKAGDDELRFVQAVAGMLATVLLRLQTEDWLAHAQRLDSLGQLTGGVAHDFNNLLTVILGNLQLLAERTETPELAALRAPVAAAARAARRGAELTARLLAFSRRQVLQPTRVDVGRLLHGLAGVLRRTLDERIALEVDAPAEGPSCRADLAQLEGAVLNLAINARDAMPEGGTLHLAAREVAALPAEVARAWPALAAGAYVELTVRDDGTGMSDEVRARAFEPFFTTKETGRGTGLGLSSVYGFVQQSQGAISLVSAPGYGTTLTLHLPAWQGERAPATPAGAGARARQRLRVLLVEDDPEVRSVVRGYLEAAAADSPALAERVHECVSVEEALACLERDAAAWDLVLSDIVLGAGLRGTDLAAQVQRRWPRLPILLMTGYASQAGGTAQRWSTLAKPFERRALAAAIDQLVGSAPAAAS
jgi:PAS domain S-box-containing protein